MNSKRFLSGVFALGLLFSGFSFANATDNGIPVPELEVNQNHNRLRFSHFRIFNTYENAVAYANEMQHEGYTTLITWSGDRRTMQGRVKVESYIYV